MTEYFLENKNTLCLFMVLLVINYITGSYMHASLTWNLVDIESYVVNPSQVMFMIYSYGP